MSVIFGHYPLRPELVESLWLVYSATHDSEYLLFAKKVMDDLEAYVLLLFLHLQS
jgi:hypothetical protein